MDKALSCMALARKAGRIELGEEPVGAATRAAKASLVIVAEDASDHTWRRAKSFVAGTAQQCIRVSYSKDQLGLAFGRTSLAIAAFTDPALALSFVKGLTAQEQYTGVLAALQEQADRMRMRQKEAKAHKRNVRTGKK